MKREQPGKPWDLAGRGGGAAQAGDLVVLRGELGEGLGAEVGEFVDRAGGLGEAFFQCGGLGLEPGDLGVAGVGVLAGVLEGLESLFEPSA